MKRAAVIFSIPMTTTPGYCWRWRSADGKTDSNGAFVYYHDCLSNAEANGYSVQRDVPHGATSPAWGSVTSRIGT